MGIEQMFRPSPGGIVVSLCVPNQVKTPGEENVTNVDVLFTTGAVFWTRQFVAYAVGVIDDMIRETEDPEVRARLRPQLMKLLQIQQALNQTPLIVGASSEGTISC